MLAPLVRRKGSVVEAEGDRTILADAIFMGVSLKNRYVRQLLWVKNSHIVSPEVAGFWRPYGLFGAAWGDLSSGQ